MYLTTRRRRTITRSVLLFGILGVALVLGLPAQAQSFQTLHADRYGQIEFNTPSGNIGCIYTPAGGTPVYETMDGDAELQCDRVEPSYVRVFIGASGAAEEYDEVGEASCCGIVQKLDYGHVAQMGPFQCLSEQRGLRCGREDGHGFFVSRAQIEVR